MILGCTLVDIVNSFSRISKFIHRTRDESLSIPQIKHILKSDSLKFL